ncbi:Hypoxic response protein 1 [subsurface metagenome]
MKNSEISRMSTTGVRIRELMTRNVVVIGPERNVSEAVKKMVEGNVECLPIVQFGELQGLITFRDIIEKVVYVKRAPEKTKVRDVMAKKMVTCRPDSTIIEVVKLMKNKRLRRVPVVNKEGRLVGIITDFDLAIFGWDI